MKFDHYIKLTADPDVTSNRLQSLYEHQAAAKLINTFSEKQTAALIQIVGLSRFLYHVLYRHPEALPLIGKPFDPQANMDITSIHALRRYKYYSLLQITWMDISDAFSYERILHDLSMLADTIITLANRLSMNAKNGTQIEHDMAIIAMGKLGAYELNFSSDIDLLFVLGNGDNPCHQRNKYECCVQHIRQLSRLLTEHSEDGFLYRLDLNLRPWGKSAPLIFSVNEYEEYYQASKEAWERIAWLRARFVAGSENIARDIISRLQPFIFHKTLSMEDVQRFLKIKHDMFLQRKKTGYWNIKLGEGGIRDIEFFIHILQIVHGAHHSALRITNTIALIAQFVQFGFISLSEQQALLGSYLFLRKLENRLQMVDEKQIHQLPQDEEELKKIARIMGYKNKNIDDAYSAFARDLKSCQQIAKQHFQGLLSENKAL